MKLRVKKSVSKRFRVTKTGKVLYGHQMGGHLRRKKSGSNLRRKRVPGQLKGTFAKKMRQMLAV
jgi:ribosomal protein L35